LTCAGARSEFGVATKEKKLRAGDPEDLLHADSPLYKELWKRYEQNRSSNPKYFENPQWPSVLAKECAESLGIKSR
jgi:hypothetical protein